MNNKNHRNYHQQAQSGGGGGGFRFAPYNKNNNNNNGNINNSGKKRNHQQQQQQQHHHQPQLKDFKRKQQQHHSNQQNSRHQNSSIDQQQQHQFISNNFNDETSSQQSSTTSLFSNTNNTNSYGDEYFTYVGNLRPTKMRASELNALIDGCVSQLGGGGGSGGSSRVNSVTTYADAIYVSFRSEQDAIDAANYFNGLVWRTGEQSLVSVYLDRCVAAVRGNEESFDSSSAVKNVDQTSASTTPVANKKRFRVNIECEVLVSDRQLKKYADSVNEKLTKELFGICSFVKFMTTTATSSSSGGGTDEASGDELLSTDLMRDAFNRNLLFVIYIDKACEQFNSINLVVLNKWRLFSSTQQQQQPNYAKHIIKENKNMPFNRAIDLMKSEYHDYIAYLKECHHTKASQSVLSSSSTDTTGQDDNNDNENDFNDDDDEETTNLENHESSYNGEDNNTNSECSRVKSTFDLVMRRFVACDRLDLADLDFILTYMGRLKREVISSGGRSTTTATTNARIPSLIQQQSSQQQQQQQQQAIPLMSLMNSSQSSSSSAATPSPTPSLMSLQYGYSNNNNNQPPSSSSSNGPAKFNPNFNSYNNNNGRKY